MGNVFGIVKGLLSCPERETGVSNEVVRYCGRCLRDHSIKLANDGPKPAQATIPCIQDKRETLRTQGEVHDELPPDCQENGFSVGVIRDQLSPDLDRSGVNRQ